MPAVPPLVAKPSLARHSETAIRAVNSCRPRNYVGLIEMFGFNKATFFGRALSCFDYRSIVYSCSRTSIAGLWTAPGWSGALGSALTIILITTAATDGREFIIADQLVLIALALGLIAAVTGPAEQIAANLESAVLRGFVVALSFFRFRALHRCISGREGRRQTRRSGWGVVVG